MSSALGRFLQKLRNTETSVRESIAEQSGRVMFCAT